MTYGAFAQDFASHEFEFQDFVSHQLAKGPRKPIPRAALCAVALALSTSVGLWALYARPGAEVSAPQSVAASPVVKPAVVAAAPVKVAPSAKIAVPLRAAQAASPVASKAEAKIDSALLYPSLTSGYAAGTFKLGSQAGVTFAAASAPHHAAAPAPTVVAALAPTAPTPPVAAPTTPSVVDVPLPLRRPAALFTPREKASPSVPVTRPIIQAKIDPTETPAAPRAPETFFDKMFNAARPSGTALAYAAPEDGGMGGIFGGGHRPAGGYDRFTAIYDITAHTVYLPDGTRLEAHSGLGPYKDNPASVAMRMVGVTPPNLYDLTFREAPFHGVRALRLTPTGGTTYGRAGLLAHTYMLRGRPPGESNGCVVFKDYQAFLRAFESGQIRRLAVVARMS